MRTKFSQKEDLGRFDLGYFVLLLLWGLGFYLGAALILNIARWFPVGPLHLLFVIPILLLPISLSMFIDKLASKVTLYIQPYYQTAKPFIRKYYELAKPVIRRCYGVAKPFIQKYYKKTNSLLFHPDNRGRRISILILIMGCIGIFGVIHIQPLTTQEFLMFATNKHSLVLSLDKSNLMQLKENEGVGAPLKNKFFAVRIAFWLGIALSFLGAIGALAFDWTYGKIVRWAKSL